jgi:rod shape-determining protein MreC
VRAALATALYPVQWLACSRCWRCRAADYFTTCNQASASEDAGRKLALQSQRAGQVEQLARKTPPAQAAGPARALATPSMAAEVLYDAADPYTRKVIIDKGMAQGVAAGSPVIDESGVLGQVTRVHPLSAKSRW